MSLAQGNNTPTRPRIEPGSPDPESDALTTRPVRPKDESTPIFVKALLYQFAFHNFSCIYVPSYLSHVLFIIVDKWFVDLFMRAPRKIGTANWVTLGK